MTKAREIAELGQKLTVDASGNLDIAGTGFFDGMALGTATGLESTKLNVQRQQGTVAQMTTTDHGENVYLQFSAEDDGGTARTGQVFFDPDLNSIGFRNGGVNVLHVENTGNLGLGGAPVPSASGYDKATAHLRQPDGGKGAQLRFTTAASGHTSADGGFISYWSDNNFYYNNLQSADHIFYTGGNARLKIANNNVLTAYGGAIFNENGDNADFRVESDALTHALFLDASSNQLAVGTSSPKTKAVFSGSSGTGSNLGDADTLINQASQGFITIENTDDTLGVEAGAIFRAKQSGAGAWAIYTKQTQDYIGDLMFRTRNGGSSSTEFMRLRNGSRTVEVKDTRGSSAQGPFLELNRESPSPADNDYGGAITFTANNDAAESISIADIWTRFHDVSDGTEDSRMTFRTRQDGTLHDRMTFREGESSFNDQSADIDFRVESNANSHMLFVDANNNKIGVDNSSPVSTLDVSGSIRGEYYYPNAATSHTGGDNGYFWKLGYVSGFSGSKSLEITIYGTDSYSAGSNITGKTTLLCRAGNGGTTMEALMWSVSNGNPHVQSAFWKNTGTNDEFEIWVKLGTFSGVENVVVTSAVWTPDLVKGTTTAPSGAVQFEYNYNMFLTAADQRLSMRSDTTVINESGLNRDFRVESDSSTNALFVDAGNNRVGVNTGSPSTNFQVSGTTLLHHSGTISSQGNAQLVIRDADSTNMRANFIVEDGTNSNRGGLMIQATEVGVTNDRDIYLNPHGGRVLIGATSGSTAQGRKLEIFDNTSATAQGPVKISNFNSSADRVMTVNTGRTSGTSDLIAFDANNTKKGSISTNGSSISYNTTSDYRLKENITDLSGAITRVKALEPKRFNFIATPDLTVDGFLAHEAQTVVPEAVTGTHNEVVVWGEGDELPDGVSVGDNRLDEDGNTIPKYQSIDQAKLVPLLTAALQEAITKIETLETQRAAMEARLAALESA